VSKLPHILIVDDEPFNIEIISELLEEEGGYRISSAENGEVALALMLDSPEDFDVILLDRMMPKMNGMEVLNNMKQNEYLQHCPVIFQTAKTSSKDIAEGLQAGAHYYLTKPFDEEVLLSVVKTAVQDGSKFKQAIVDLDKNQNLMGLLHSACFEFKTIEDARNLASLLSHVYPDPTVVIMGLTELMINAIEHGNLAISYDEKTKLNEQGTWLEEVNRRLTLSENMAKYALVEINYFAADIQLTITDCGQGFNWGSYLDFCPERVMDNHGRGIAMANQMSFTEVNYKGKGNIVCTYFKL